MKNDRLIPGLILVLIGALFLLNNYNVIDFHWSNILYLWPVFLIMGGVNLVFASNRSAWATALKVGVVILGFGLLIFVPANHRYFWNNHNGNFNFSDHDTDGDNDEDNDGDTDSKGLVKIEGSSSFNEPFTAGTAKARLKISGGATVYTIKDTTNQLFQANTEEHTTKYEFTRTMDGAIPVLDLHMKHSHRHGFNWDSDDADHADVKLNTRPEWEIAVEAGASTANLDLEKFKVKELKISGGAASFEVKMGQPLAETNVNVSTGASGVTIKVPQNAACRIIVNSGLSSNEFNGFDKKDDNSYETPGFDAAKNKMFINMKGGVSDFKVQKY